MEAVIMDQVEAEEGLVEYEAALQTRPRSRSTSTDVTIIVETVTAMDGNVSQQRGEIERSFYFEGNEIGGIEYNYHIDEEKLGNEKSDYNITKSDSQKSLVAVDDLKRDGNLKEDSLHDFHLLPSEKLESGGNLSFEPFDFGLEECADDTLFKDGRQEVTELDVERVIEEQNTHDLYCPNCNSCITRRVILRKRKRKIRSIHYDGKREKIDTVVNLDGSTSAPAIIDDNLSTTPPVDDPVRETERDIFRCVSCFTFFIPTVKQMGNQNLLDLKDNEWLKELCVIEVNHSGWSGGLVGEQRSGDNDAVNIPTDPEINVDSGHSVGAVVNVPTDPEVNVDSTALGRTYEWDVLKSIIYGGLIESITSLGVVSSAAATDSTTLNIVILGLANLMSGLIILIHNIKELNKDCHGETSQGSSNIDRYQETLGRRENFRLHAVVAVMSYIVFGLLPPVIYGFSFYSSNDKLYKLITCGAASFVCIILLSIGKAYVQKPPKPYVKTVLNNLLVGLTASGLCYAVGLLSERLLEKLGWFETLLAPSTAFLETRSIKPGRAFYG
ncbi:hypothetical protein NE237_004743 [Protea cynaroides]|uniref:Membrane protein of ER body-like protein n=1 Tax=Protea cynaroides TaxID=273540 RepID=A0A9Q0KJH2_9MAGN|nr:hypothetical protein NE237_004743 [Protea cynaroides]